MMQVLRTPAELRAWRDAQGAAAFVPTMGNLHAGHLRLVEEAQRRAPAVVASIFVNPLQFGPGEDYERYPRTWESDCTKLADIGCDAVFAPAAADMYPRAQTCFVAPPPLAEELCGAHRPGHFRGVLTVVLKLFNLVRPQAALFGKKDYQQLALVRDMAAQFALPITIVGVDTVRADDGMALSSRNGYLGAAERAEAPRLYRTLEAAAERLRAGERDFPRLEKDAAQTLTDAGWKVDYVAVREAGTLATARAEGGEFVVLAAAWLGGTRLIDNLEAAPG